MPLREYQQEAVHQLRAAIKKYGSAVYVLPTGAGKTVVAGEIARLAAAKGSLTFFLVHRRELVKQAVDTLLEQVPGVSIGVECSGWPKMPWAPLQVGMVQSVARREYVAKPDLVIIDEAHHARAKTWETVLGRWPNAKTNWTHRHPGTVGWQGTWATLWGHCTRAYDPGTCRAGKLGSLSNTAYPKRTIAGWSWNHPKRRLPGRRARRTNHRRGHSRCCQSISAIRQRTPSYFLRSASGAF